MVAAPTIGAMSQFKLLRPEEVIERWPDLSGLLHQAVRRGNGELLVADILKLVLGGKMFIFADEKFAVTCEFVTYPQKTIMVAGFGAGEVEDLHGHLAVLSDFARMAGASSIQTYVSSPAMVRYYKQKLDLEPRYTVLEKTI